MAESLRGRSLPELREMLGRQQKLLEDRKFISRLPDKGKKISDFVEKLKVAVAEEEGAKRNAELLLAVRLEFQKKREATGSSKQSLFSGSNNLVQENLAGVVESLPGSTSSEQLMGPLDGSGVTPQSETDIPAAACEEDLSEAFGRISVGGSQQEGKDEKQKTVKSKTNPFQRVPHTAPRTPHYIDVLEMRAKNPVRNRSRFKTNVLPADSRGSSSGSPQTPSPGGPSASISAEERRRRDMKHLDDVTAARLPPLHHEPARLLSVAESLALQVWQKEAYEEMQAKLAAQKLAGKLGIRMDRFEPEGEAATGYRELQDEEGDGSAED